MADQRIELYVVYENRVARYLTHATSEESAVENFANRKAEGITLTARACTGASKDELARVYYLLASEMLLGQVQAINQAAAQAARSLIAKPRH